MHCFAQFANSGKRICVFVLFENYFWVKVYCTEALV